VAVNAVYQERVGPRFNTKLY